MMEQYAPVAGQGAKIIGVLLLVGLVIVVVVKPVVKAALTGPRAVAVAGGAAAFGALPRTVQDIEGEIEAQLTAAADQKRLDTVRMPVLTKKANAIVQNEPEAAARLVRSWLVEGER
jgi:flagellar biosynthesis/type III secretory pathway M-ring protein FliF/YscJ